MTPLIHADGVFTHSQDTPHFVADGEKESVSAIVLRAFCPEDSEAFRQLNEAWITRWFALEAEDVAILGDPQAHILEHGGQIVVAASGAEVVGCFALLPTRPGVLRLIRMTVLESYRGRGVGRMLLQRAIELARMAKAVKLVLETSGRLESAVHLYESAGFQRIPPEPGAPLPLSRADIFMELPLSYG